MIEASIEEFYDGNEIFDHTFEKFIKMYLIINFKKVFEHILEIFDKLMKI